MKEAEADFKLKNFNKCASACYFSVRKALEDMFIRMGIMIPRRDDKLANILKNIGYEDKAKLFLRLYELRKKADYNEKEITEEEAKESLETAKRILALINMITKSF